MALTYHTLANLTIKGLCIALRNSTNPRDQINAAEMLHSRLVESVLSGGLTASEKIAIHSALRAVEKSLNMESVYRGMFGDSAA